MRASDAGLLLGAVARLTRFITVDDLGHWWIKGPLEGVAARAALKRHPSRGWDGDDVDTWPAPLKAAHGLSCPWCVSVWLSLAGVGTYALATRDRRAMAVWRGMAGALTASYLTGVVQTHLTADRA